MVSLLTNLPQDGSASQEQLDSWLDELLERRSAKDVALLREAAQIARRVNQGEQAADGSNMFLSLLHTVDTLDGLKLDIEPLLAAMLSELPGREGYEPKEIERRFGAAVVAMVEQVSHIRELSATGSENVDESGVENLRRMLLGIANDVRAILVVLAKRLQLMRRLKRLPREVQQRVARETQLVHAPLANRLGVWQLKWELEDLCLRHLEPEQYTSLAGQLDGKRREREAFVADVGFPKAEIRLKLQIELPLAIRGRPIPKLPLGSKPHEIALVCGARLEKQSVHGQARRLPAYEAQEAGNNPPLQALEAMRVKPGCEETLREHARTGATIRWCTHLGSRFNVSVTATPPRTVLIPS